jgi:hypothetical protein
MIYIIFQIKMMKVIRCHLILAQIFKVTVNYKIQVI